MSKTWVAPKEGPPPVGPYSPAVIANGFVFVSGQIPLDPATGQLVEGPFEEQVRRVLENLKSVIEAAGSTLDDVVKVTIFLVDLGRFEELNRVYAEYFSTSKPARSTIQAARLPKDVQVEMDAIAVLPR